MAANNKECESTRAKTDMYQPCSGSSKDFCFVDKVTGMVKDGDPAPKGPKEEDIKIII